LKAKVAVEAIKGERTRRRWWTKGGSKRILDSEESLRAAVRYVMNHGR